MTELLPDKPDETSTLSVWLDYIGLLHKKPIDMGLERVHRVARQLNVLNPVPYVITVAGTNGKGTTCRMLEAMLMEGGYRVGVYSSPDLIRFNERVRINNLLVTDQDLVDAFVKIEQHRGATTITFFEAATLAALLIFKKADLDVIILEVGLGGRLDATNIIDANIAVITSIDLDHTDKLGYTRDAIGREKAGIFRPNQLAIVGEDDLPASILDYANHIHAQLKTKAAKDWEYYQTEQGWRWTCEEETLLDLPVPGIPLVNAATALATLHYSPFKLAKDAVRTALANATLPGRMQLIRTSPAVILDVAHNPHAATYLNSQLERLYPIATGTVRRIVIGMLKDKDIPSTLKRVDGDVWYCGSISHYRGAKGSDIAQFLPGKCAKVFDSVKEAWECALADARKDDVIVVYGSFHTVANVMETLDYEKSNAK